MYLCVVCDRTADRCDSSGWANLSQNEQTLQCSCIIGNLLKFDMFIVGLPLDIVGYHNCYIWLLSTALSCRLDEAGEEPPTIPYVISDVCLVLYTLELHLVSFCCGIQRPRSTGNLKCVMFLL